MKPLLEIERVLVDPPLKEAVEGIQERAYGIAHGLACAAQKRPCTLAEIDMFVDAGCQDLANDLLAGGRHHGLSEAETHAAIVTAQAIFRKYFKPLALEIVPIVEPKDSIAQMTPEGSA